MVLSTDRNHAAIVNAAPKVRFVTRDDAIIDQQRPLVENATTAVVDIIITKELIIISRASLDSHIRDTSIHAGFYGECAALIPISTIST